MRKFLVTLLLFVAACGDGILAPSLKDVNGTYELVAVQGNPTPVVIENGLIPAIIESGALVLDSGQKFYTISLHVCSPNFLCVLSTVSAGTFELINRTIYFTQLEIDSDTNEIVVTNEFTATVRNKNNVVLYWLENKWTFVK